MPRLEAGEDRRPDLEMIKVGARAIGEVVSRDAIDRTLSALYEMQDRAARERDMAIAAAEREAAPTMDALAALLKERGVAADPKAISLKLERALLPLEQSFGPQHTFMLPLGKHVNVYGPPYDFGWSWGNPVRQTSDPQTGICSVTAQSHLTRSAAAGIGLVLTSDKPAFVTVRPFIPTMWTWTARGSGIGSWAAVSGGIDASAWVDGHLCTKVRRDQAFRDKASAWDGTKKGEGDGSAWADSIELEFFMSPGKPYVVNYGAWVDCGQNLGLGEAGATGNMVGTVRFVVVNRYVAG